MKWKMWLKKVFWGLNIRKNKEGERKKIIIFEKILVKCKFGIVLKLVVK